MAEAKWPEHVRLMALRDERDHVQGFLDWLLDDADNGEHEEPADLVFL